MVNERDTQYLLLTPGPLSTTRTVREAMMQEFSTWDVDYNSIVAVHSRALGSPSGDAMIPIAMPTPPRSYPAAARSRLSR